jgi:broad specificity phosphatase PhoE
MVYLVRHGQTPWNKDGIFRGRRDIPLSDVGRLQAKRTGKWLSTVSCDAVFTSPLSRSRETASIIADHVGCETEVSRGLTDIDFGSWEGKNTEQVASEYARSYEVYRYTPEQAAFPEGEALSACAERAIRTFHEIATCRALDRGHRGDSPHHRIIVTHRVILKLIVLGILGLSISQFWAIRLDTCSITEIARGEGGFVIRTLNGTCHLEELGSERADF